jgi:hypothetical protein
VVTRKQSLRIGGGSACPGERIEPAIELIEKGEIDYIAFDSLSEPELSAFVKHKMSHPDEGYDTYTERRLRAILPLCAEHGVKVLGNMGGANPLAAHALALDTARRIGLQGTKVATVVGDDVLGLVKELNPEVEGSNKRALDFGDALIAAHAYIPADSMIAALAEGADLVIAGRVGDASLFLAPMMHEFGWADDDWDRMAMGIVVGHLMECAGQLSGGYYADPPYKVVPDLHKIGFPIAEVTDDADVLITKVDGSGGLVSRGTCAEQMLYEVHDPANYIGADVVTDLSDVDFKDVGPNRVAVTGTVKGKPKPDMLKVNLSVTEGVIAEGSLFYAGPGALERAKLAAEIIRKRLELVVDFKGQGLRFDLLGVNALYGPPESDATPVPWEVGLRVTARAAERDEAWKVMHELETIDNNGPAAIGRALRKEDVREVVAYFPTFVPRERVPTDFRIEDA